MPIDYSKYPDNWFSEIRPRILEREGNSCKFCGIADRLVGWRVPSGAFYTPEDFASAYIPDKDLDGLIKAMKRRPNPYQIILTVAHLDHMLIDHDDGNLAALCQRCHLNHDRAATARQRSQSRRYGRKKRQFHLDFLSDICQPLISSPPEKKTNSADRRPLSKSSPTRPKSVPS